MSINWGNLETFSGSLNSTSTASSGDDFLRSFQSSLAGGLAPSFAWPGTGGSSLSSAGVSQFGNLRCAVAGNSAVTGGYNDGFLLLDTAHISLHHIGSTWTGMLGHSSMVEHSAASTGAVTRWSVQSGTLSLTTFSQGSFGVLNQTFTTPYTTAASIVVLLDSSQGSWIVGLSSVTTGGFSANFSGVVAQPVAASVFWLSEGT